MKTTTSLFQISIACALLCAWLFMLYGGAFIFNSQKEEIRKEVRKKLEHGLHMDNLVTFDLHTIQHDKSFNWVNNHEFEFQNRLYDIVKTDKNILICYDDTEESELISAFRNLQSKGKQTSLKQSPFILLYFKQEEAIPYFDSSCSNSNFVYHAKNWNDIIHDVLVSPPNC